MFFIIASPGTVYGGHLLRTSRVSYYPPRKHYSFPRLQVCASNDEKCRGFAKQVLAYLSDDPETNRDHLSADGFCKSFYETTVKDLAAVC